MVRYRRLMPQRRATSALPIQIVFDPTCQQVTSSSTYPLPCGHDSAVFSKARYWRSGREIVMSSNRTSTCKATETVLQRRKLVKIRRTCYTKTTFPPAEYMANMTLKKDKCSLGRALTLLQMCPATMIYC